MPWKAPITADRCDCTELAPDPRWSSRRRLLALAIVVTVLTASLLAMSAWRSNSVPARIYWCNRDWGRSSGLPAVRALPPDVSPGLPWTVAKRTRAGSFYLPLSSASRCPANTSTVGYLHHGGHYISYGLSGGP